MSAFDRHPMREQYEAAARAFAPKNAIEILQAMQRQAAGEKVRIPPARYVSAQNRRVRFAVDTDAARAKGYQPIAFTRQQRRYQKRMGHRIEAVGPEEV